MRRLLIMGFLLVVTACSSGAGPDDTTTTTVPRVETLAPPPTTTTTEPPPVLNNEQDAYQYLFGFNPVAGNVAGLQAALELLGGHRPGLPTPQWIAEGTDEVRAAILEELAKGGTWNTHILVAMALYGRPNGTFDQPVPWQPAVRVQITAARELALQATFGDLAGLAIAVIERMLDAELVACGDTCTFAGTWYQVPQAVSFFEGSFAGNRWQGEVWITSDTGEGSQAPIALEEGLGGWAIVDGYLASYAAPLIIVDWPPNGLHLTEPIVFLSGVTVDATRVTVAGVGYEPIDLELGEVGVELAPGQNDLLIVASNDAGLEASVSVIVFYDPGAERRIAYLSEVGATAATVDFVEIFVGPEADDAAREDGAIGEGESIGVYVRNAEPLLEPVSLAPAPTVLLYDSDVVLTPITVDLLGDLLAGRADPSAWYGGSPSTLPFWLTIGNGQIVQVEQQYLP